MAVRNPLMIIFKREIVGLFSVRPTVCGQPNFQPFDKLFPLTTRCMHQGHGCHKRRLTPPCLGSYSGTVSSSNNTDNFQRRSIQGLASSSTVSKRKRVPLKHQTSENSEKVLAEHAAVVQEFADLLQCPVEDVQQMVKCDTRLVTHFPKRDVLAKIRLLMSHGFDARDITPRYQLFSRSIDFLRSRLTTLASVKPYRHHLSLLLLPNAEFEHRMETYRKEVDVLGDHASQISFIADLLGVSETEVLSLASSGCHHLLTMRPSRLLEVVQILQSYGIGIEEIRDKCQVLKCVPDEARSRLQQVCDAKVLDPGKLERILLSTDTQFQSSLTRWRRDADALGGLPGKREMLLKRLGCLERELEDMMLQAPALKPLSPAKLADNLHVLLDVLGLDPSSIVHHPALLFFSRTRLLTRWSILQDLNLTEYDLIRALIMPDRKFVNKFTAEFQT